MDYFIEERRSHILFIPGIFIEDCIDTDKNTSENNFSYIKPELIENINELENSDHDTDEEDSDYVFDKEVCDKNGLKIIDLIPNNLDYYKKNIYDTNINIIYDSVPKYYIDFKSWIKSINLLCCFCHDNILGVPFPIALGQTKILLPTENTEVYITLPNKADSFDKLNDDNLLYSCQSMKEVKAYNIHDIVCCDIVCVGNYIRKITDTKITNKKESIKMSISIYNNITGQNIEDIPEKDLWCIMKQYCGNNGQSRNDYRDKNSNKEIKLKQAMKIIY